MKKLNQEYNKTSLRERVHGETVHRDYLAHVLRWGFAMRLIRDGDVVVDVGCGPDAALEKTLVKFPHPPIPKKLYAIDLVHFKPPFNERAHEWIVWMPGTNIFDAVIPEYGDVDLVVCLEVIEHMPLERGRRLLEWIYGALKDDGRCLLSTPVHDGRHMPKNHVHEYTIPELWNLIDKANLQVVKRWGAFMNVNDARKCLAERYPGAEKIYDDLSEYYSNEVMSVLFSPLFADAARNNVWMIKKRR